MPFANDWPQQKGTQEVGNQLYCIQKDSGTNRTKHLSADAADDESGTRTASQHEEQLCVTIRKLALGEQVSHKAGADGISAKPG